MRMGVGREGNSNLLTPDNRPRRERGVYTWFRDSFPLDMLDYVTTRRHPGNPT